MKRDEKKVWHAELDRIIEANCGLIEIFGQIIGKMPNDISYREAKGYIKAFLIIGWNSELEAQFVAVASAHNKNKMDFVTNIHKEVKEIPYHDPDIQFAIYDKIAPIQDSPVTQEMVMTDSSETSLINTARYNEYGGTSK